MINSSALTKCDIREVFALFNSIRMQCVVGWAREDSEWLLCIPHDLFLAANVSLLIDVVSSQIARWALSHDVVRVSQTARLSVRRRFPFRRGVT